MTNEQIAALDRMIDTSENLARRLRELRDEHDASAPDLRRRLFGEVSNAYFRLRASWNEGWRGPFGGVPFDSEDV